MISEILTTIINSFFDRSYLPNSTTNFCLYKGLLISRNNNGDHLNYVWYRRNHPSRRHGHS